MWPQSRRPQSKSLNPSRVRSLKQRTPNRDTPMSETHLLDLEGKGLEGHMLTWSIRGSELRATATIRGSAMRGGESFLNPTYRLGGAGIGSTLEPAMPGWGPSSLNRVSADADRGRKTSYDSYVYVSSTTPGRCASARRRLKTQPSRRQHQHQEA